MQSLALQTKFQFRKSTIIRRMAFGIAIVALAIIFLPAKQSFAANREHWMSQLDQNIKVSQLSIPGTHDSSTFWLNGTCCEMAQCQSMTFEEQLSAGVRAFDLRYAYDGGSFGIYHGDTQPFVYTCHEKYKEHWYDLHNKDLYLADIFAKFNKFLKDHPDEFIVVNVQREKGESGTRVDDALKAMYEKYNVYTSRNDSTKISDVKGRIVLGNDFMQKPGENSPYNRYKGTDDQKLKDLDEVFTNAPITSKADNTPIEQKIIYTNLSWRGNEPFETPKDFATRVHARFFDCNPFAKYESKEQDNYKAYGVIFYDYPSTEMLDMTIQANDWAIKS